MPLRVTIELIPRGDEARKRKIAIIDITNDGTGTKEFGNYLVRAEGETMGGWDLFANTKLYSIGRNDYVDQAIDCLTAIRNKMKERK